MVGGQEDKNEDGAQASSVEINTSKLPPHIILGMPALSPTMVINQFYISAKVNDLFFLFLPPVEI